MAILGTSSHTSSMPMIAFDWHDVISYYCSIETLDLGGTIVKSSVV